MIKDQRKKYSDEKTDEILKGYIKILDEAIALDKDGDHEAAQEMFEQLKADASKQVEKLDSTYSKQFYKKHEAVNRKMLPNNGELLGERSGCKLVAFDDSFKDLFLKTEAVYAGDTIMYKKEEFRNQMWNECKKEYLLCYGVMDKTNEYMGYVSIKDTRESIWEASIVLLPEYRYHGYGKEALIILFDELYNRTGEKLFRARVDADNYVSQALMRKLGARTNGISEFIIHGEELEIYQKENLALIDEQFMEVAEEFCVDAEDLLGCVLEYLIDWPQEKFLYRGDEL